MKRAAAGAHLLTHWRFEPAKRPEDRADYCFAKQGRRTKKNVGGVRYESRSRGRSPPDLLSLRNAQTIEPTTAWVQDDGADYYLGTIR